MSAWKVHAHAHARTSACMCARMHRHMHAQEVDEWIKDPKLWVELMAVLDYSHMAVIEQRWAAAICPKWNFLTTFRAHQLTHRVLFSIMKSVWALEKDSLCAAHLPNSRREYLGLCQHSAAKGKGKSTCKGCQLKIDLKSKFDDAAKTHSVSPSVYPVYVCHRSSSIHIDLPSILIDPHRSTLIRINPPSIRRRSTSIRHPSTSIRIDPPSILKTHMVSPSVHPVYV